MKRIDLHGVKHADVQRQLDIFFWECIQEGVKSAIVVTGNSTRMKGIVTEVVKDYNFKLEPFNNGSTIVQM